MATPYNPVQSVMPNVPQDYSRATATPDAFGAQVGEATQRAGLSLLGAGDKVFAAAADFQKRQDEADVDAVYSRKFAPAFRTLYGSYYSLQGKDAVDQMPVFQAKMQKLAEDTADALPNARQKHQFISQSRKQVQIELDGMARHAAAQNNAYQLETFKSALDNIGVMAADKYNDEAAFGSYLGDARFSIEKYGTSHGKSSEWMRDVYNEQASKMAIARLSRQMVGSPQDVEAANRWWKEPGNQSMVAPAMRPKIDHELKQALRPVQLSGVADRAIPSTLTTAVNNAISINGASARSVESSFSSKRVAAAIFGQESGSGTANTAFVNPQGVTGPMQIKDTTWKQYQDAGVIPRNLKWDNPADNKIGGDLLVDHYYRKYLGDPAKVAAAYYGGEGAVNPNGTINRHWKNLQRPTDPTVGQYVDQVVARIKPEDATPQQTQTYRDIRAGYAEAVANSDRESEKLHPGDVVFRDQARSEVTRRIGVLATAQQGLQNQAFGKVVDALAGRNGGEPPTTWEALYTQPGMRDAVPLLSETAYATVQGVIERNARRDEDKPGRKNADLVNSGYSGIVNGEITDASQIYAMMSNGLNAHGADYLVKKFEESQKPGGLKYGHMVDQAGKAATKILSRDFIISSNPATAAYVPIAVSKFMIELDDRIKKEEAKPGGNPRALVDPTSKEYMLRPELLKQFMPTGAGSLQDSAAAAMAQARAQGSAGIIGVPSQPQGAVTIKNEADYAALKPGTRFKGPDGKERIKP